MNKNLKSALILLGAALLVFLAFTLIINRQTDDTQEKSTTSLMKDNEQKEAESVDLDKEMINEMEDEQYDFSGVLKDVLNSESVSSRRGLALDTGASGVAKYKYKDGMYKLLVEFSDLQDPNNDDFYEGWVVRQSPFAFISTDKAVKEDDEYVNRFMSEVDYREYDLYVLTIEPNDGDPAPAGHVLEGKMDERL